MLKDIVEYSKGNIGPMAPGIVIAAILLIFLIIISLFGFYVLLSQVSHAYNDVFNHGESDVKPELEKNPNEQLLPDKKE